MKTITKICIGCPAGCHLAIQETENGSVKVAGATCRRGTAYAEQEMKDPRRIVTAVVRTRSEKLPYLPVKTDRGLPLRKISPLLKTLYSLRVEHAKRGDILIRDFDGTSVNIIVTRDLEE